MPFCTNCGKEVRTDQKFCWTCGSPVLPADQGTTTPVSPPAIIIENKAEKNAGYSVSSPQDQQQKTPERDVRLPQSQTAPPTVTPILTPEPMTQAKAVSQKTVAASVQGPDWVKGALKGTARQVQLLSEPTFIGGKSSTRQVLTFRLERTDEVGNIIELIPVEYRAIRMSGASIKEGDRIAITGNRKRTGIFLPRRIYNFTTNSETTGEQGAGLFDMLLAILGFFSIFPGLLLVAALVANSATASSGFFLLLAFILIWILNAIFFIRRKSWSPGGGLSIGSFRVVSAVAVVFFAFFALLILLLALSDSTSSEGWIIFMSFFIICVIGVVLVIFNYLRNK